MSNTVKHFGIINSGVIEQPESGSWYVTAEGIITTLKYVGNKANIVAFNGTLPSSHPELGDKGFPKFDKDEGNVWTLEVQYTLRWSENGGLAELPRRVNPYIQMNTQDIQKPLESHPMFGLVDTDGVPFSDTPWQYEAWKNSPISRKIAFEFSTKKEPDVTNDDDWHRLEEDVVKLAKRVMAGQDSYLVGSQIVTQVTVFTRRPPEVAVNKDYKISQPPSGQFSSNQKYLQKPSSLSQGQDGNWTMTDTWTGADYWDKELYKNA